MADNDEIPTGFGDAAGRKTRTYQREDVAAGSDYDRVDERLELENGPDRLPWLEADDEPYDLERPDNGRLLGFGLLGLVALAALIGGVWWATNRSAENTLVADGSTINAPSAPFKIPPEDPGGKKFDGTGDSAFAVSEGKDRAVTLGEGSPTGATSMAVAPAVAPVAVPTKAVASPSLAMTKPAVPAPVAAPAPRKSVAAPTVAAAQPAVSRGPVVQVGAYSTRASADAAWSRMAAKYDALSGQRHQVVEGQADIGRVFRLQVISGDSGSANALCGKLKSSGLACQVKN